MGELEYRGFDVSNRYLFFYDLINVCESENKVVGYEVFVFNEVWFMNVYNVNYVFVQ